MTLTFRVCYKNKEASLTLDENNKLLHLKAEVAKEFGIRLEEISIEGWADRDDYDILKNFCKTADNYLTVSRCQGKPGNKEMSRRNYCQKFSKILYFQFTAGRPKRNRKFSTETRFYFSENSSPESARCIQFQQKILNHLDDRIYNVWEPSELEHLKPKIGYAFFGPPGQCGYDAKQNIKIDSMYNVILKENNKIAKWHDRVVVSIIYNCTEPLPEEKAKLAERFSDYNPEAHLDCVPIFILRKCKHSENPCRIFIDDLGRVYRSWKQYLTRNKLEECKMVLPKNGRYKADQNGNVILERLLSPAAQPGQKIIRGIDIAGTVGGVTAGGVFIVASATAVAPVALAAAGAVGFSVGVYSIGRSIYHLVDRRKHKQTISFRNPEARGAYLAIATGVFGFVAMGIQQGVQTSGEKGGSASSKVFNLTSVVISCVGVSSAAYDIFTQLNKGQRVSTLTMLQLSFSFFFFSHSIYNCTISAQIKLDSTTIKLDPATFLKDSGEKIVSAMFSKIDYPIEFVNSKFNEKTNPKNPDENKGQSEAEEKDTINADENLLYTEKTNAKPMKETMPLRIVPNEDQTIDFFTNNKAVSKKGLEFTTQNGRISLNGVVMDMNQMANMRKTELFMFHAQLLTTAHPTSPQIQSMKANFQVLQSNIPVKELEGLILRAIKLFGATDQETTQMVISALAKLLDFLSDERRSSIMQQLHTMFQGRKFFKLLEVANRFLQSLIIDLEEKYTAWFTNESSAEEGYFRFLPSDAAMRVEEFLKNVGEDYFTGNRLNAEGWSRFLVFFHAWFAQEYLIFLLSQERRGQRKSSQRPASKKKCADCGGFFYKPGKSGEKTHS